MFPTLLNLALKRIVRDNINEQQKMKVNEKSMMLKYVNNIIMIEEIKKEFVKMTTKLLCKLVNRIKCI